MQEQTISNSITQRNALIKKAIELAPRTIKKEPIRDNSPKTTKDINNSSSSENPFSVDFGDSAYMINGIHYRIYDYFDIPIRRVTDSSIKKLGYIQDIIVKKFNNVEDALKAISLIDRKLGMNDLAESKLHKIYSWIRLKHGEL